MLTLERTKQDTLHMVNGVITTIKELHEYNVPQLNLIWQDAKRRFCQPDESAAAMRLLEISFGLASLAVYTAKLQEAIENDEYARKLWSNTSIN